MAYQGACIFVIIPEFFDPDRGYELGVIWLGYQGIYSTGYYCGYDFDLARDWANNYNQKQGFDPTFTAAVMEISLGLRIIPTWGEA